MEKPVVCVISWLAGEVDAQLAVNILIYLGDDHRGVSFAALEVF